MRPLLSLLLLAACTSTKDGDTADTADTSDTDTSADTDTGEDTDTDTDTDTSDTDTDTDTDTSDTDTDTATAPDGAALYTSTCATCHGADGRGMDENPDITGEVDNTDAELLDVIQNGKGDMPAQPLDAAEAQAVIDWMRATF